MTNKYASVFATKSEREFLSSFRIGTIDGKLETGVTFSKISDQYPDYSDKVLIWVSGIGGLVCVISTILMVI